MSDIQRVTIWGCVYTPASSGKWVRYDDHRAEVERLTARQTDMETHITGLTTELHRTRADGIELRWVADEVEQLTAQRDAAQAEVERLRANGQAILDSSRPDDETIWREAFMAAVHDVHKNWMDVADVALAQYRKRWPR